MSEARLTTRQEAILGAVCRDYIVTGREVSSAGLIRTHGFEWSSATIRQELAVLEQLGLLKRAHRSAGRIPTSEGLLRYVKALPTADEPRPELVAAVDRSLRDLARPDAGMRAAAFLLSELSGCVAVSFLGTARVGVIREIDVVPLVRDKALVALTMNDGSTVMRPVAFESSSAQPTSDWLRLQERLRWLCRGRTLEDARHALFELHREQEARFDRVLGEALRLGLSLCTGASLDPLWLQVAGQPSLTRELPQLDRLGEVLELLEDVHRLADVLCQLLPEPHSGAGARAQVRFGLDGLLVDASDDAEPAGLSLVGCRLPVRRSGEGSDEAPYTGAVALLGSDRMDYAAVIPLVEYAARALAARASA